MGEKGLGVMFGRRDGLVAIGWCLVVGCWGEYSILLHMASLIDSRWYWMDILAERLPRP